MTPPSVEITMGHNLRKATFIAGIMLVLIGAVGVFLPQVMSVTISVMVACLLMAGGLFMAYLTWQGYRNSWMAWLKAFVLMVLGLLIAFHPAAGAAALGLVLVVYFLLNGFACITFALELRPRKGWGWMVCTGLLSSLLAIVFLIGWPFSATWLVGLFVGITLFFDGIALLVLGLAANKA